MCLKARVLAHQLLSRSLKYCKFSKVTLCICSLLYLLPVGRGGIIYTYVPDWLKFVSPVGYSLYSYSPVKLLLGLGRQNPLLLNIRPSISETYYQIHL